MAKRNDFENVTRAHNLIIVLCDKCDAVHIILKDKDGNSFAEAILQPDIAKDVARDIQTAANGGIAVQ